MKAAVLRQTGRALSIEELVPPAPGEGQLVVKLQAAGVCRSQYLEVSGGRGPDPHLPHLIGHEGVGIVIEAGAGVVKAKPGDQVVLTWIRGAGTDGGSVVYRSAAGPVNAGPIATFCETAVVSEQRVVRLARPVDPRIAVLAGCALPTGSGTVWNAMTGGPSKSVCIFGAGGVGLASVWAAAHARWGTIAVVDTFVPRLERARAAGATHVFSADAPGLEAALRAASGGGGFDLSVECAGAPDAMELAVRVARAPGGNVVLAGNLAAGAKISIDPFDLIQGRSLRGSWGGGVRPDQDIPLLVELAAAGALPHHLLLGKSYRLDQANEAIRALDSGAPGRPFIEFP